MLDLNSLSDTELNQLRLDILDEQEKRYFLTNAKDQIKQISEKFEEISQTMPPTPWENLTDRVGPGQSVILPDGNEYKNTSGAWLPTTAGPVDYRQGWTQTTGLPEEIPPFTVGEDVVPGDIRSYNGTNYRVIQAHTAAEHWPPDQSTSLWTVA